MNGKKRSYTALTGLFTAFCMVLLVAQNAWAQAENNNENNTSESVIFMENDGTSKLIFLQVPAPETKGTNTSQTIVLEIDDARSRESPTFYYSWVLLVLILLILSLLLIHILMHHTREDGKSTTTPASSLLGEKTNPIEDKQPRKEKCGQEPFPLPLALSVLEAMHQDHGPEPSTRTPSMGYPIGYADFTKTEAKQ